MKLYSLRVKSGQDLRRELLAYAKSNNIKAGSIVTCVGALKLFQLRMAGATSDNQDVRIYTETHEIVSLVGTLTGDDCHLHIALSDENGAVIGGHLKEGSLVDLTAEVVIAEHEDVVYTREFDEDTKFTELVVKSR